MLCFSPYRPVSCTEPQARPWRLQGAQLSAAAAAAAADAAEAGAAAPTQAGGRCAEPKAGPSEVGAASEGHGLVLPFEPITITFRDVRYFAPVLVRPGACSQFVAAALLSPRHCPPRAHFVGALAVMKCEPSHKGSNHVAGLSLRDVALVKNLRPGKTCFSGSGGGRAAGRWSC